MKASEGGTQYKFVNFLEYVKVVYNISVHQLASFVGVQRQSIYNYFKLESDDLPSSIKEKIAEVYNAISFEAVLEKERQREIHRIQFYEPVLMAALDGSEVPEDLIEVFLPFVRDDGTLMLQDEYDFQQQWYRAIYLEKPYKPAINPIEQRPDPSTKHSTEYMRLLISIIDKEIPKDDLNFLLYVSQYRGDSK
jgi:hypothetical protein